MPVFVTPLYAAVIAVVFVALSIRVIVYRRTNRIGLGDDGDRQLIRLMRAQANCAEYAPLGLLLMLIAELQGVPIWMLHTLGVLLVLGRLMHGIGFSSKPQKMNLRVLGMAFTLAQILSAAALLLIYSLL